MTASRICGLRINVSCPSIILIREYLKYLKYHWLARRPRTTCKLILADRQIRTRQCSTCFYVATKGCIRIHQRDVIGYLDENAGLEDSVGLLDWHP